MPSNLVNDSALKIAQYLTELRDLYLEKNLSQNHAHQLFYQLAEETVTYNPWYTPDYVIKGLGILIGDLIKMSDILRDKLPLTNVSKKKIGFITSSNRPFEDFSEILFIALSGFDSKVKVQSDNQFILRKLLELLTDFNLDISEEENKLTTSAYISFSGLTNTASEYLSRYHLLELPSTGNSLIISGNETSDELKAIADSLCLFFTRSKRNIKLIFVPVDYNLYKLESFISIYADQLTHYRYLNNYEYRKSVMIINRIQFIEMAPLLFTESTDQTGYISVVTIVRYRKPDDLQGNDLIKKYPVVIYSSEMISRNPLSTFETNYPLLLKFIEETRFE